MEEGLKGSDLERKIIENQGKTKVHLEIPMFRIVSEIPLLSTLNNIGMTKMFQHAVASFKGKSDFPLYLSDAIHKAFIEVEKTRTEATATAIMGRTKVGQIILSSSLSRTFKQSSCFSTEGSMYLLLNDRKPM